MIFLKKVLTSAFRLCIITHVVETHADVAHLVERHLAKVEVASSSLVVRSKISALLLQCAFVLSARRKSFEKTLCFVKKSLHFARDSDIILRHLKSVGSHKLPIGVISGLPDHEAGSPLFAVCAA